MNSNNMNWNFSIPSNISNKKESKKVIEYKDYCIIVGLLELARSHRDKLQDIEETMAEVLDAPEEYNNYYGHISDSVWENYSADHLLKIMDIEVSE